MTRSAAGLNGGSESELFRGLGMAQGFYSKRRAGQGGALVWSQILTFDISRRKAL